MSSSQISFRNSKLVSSLESRNFESVNSNLEFPKAKFFLTPNFAFRNSKFRVCKFEFRLSFWTRNFEAGTPITKWYVPYGPPLLPVDFGARKKISTPPMQKSKHEVFQNDKFRVSKLKMSSSQTRNFDFALRREISSSLIRSRKTNHKTACLFLATRCSRLRRPKKLTQNFEFANSSGTDDRQIPEVCPGARACWSFDLIGA